MRGLNARRSGLVVPVFVDPHRTPCAVGYLMLRSAEHTLVAVLPYVAEQEGRVEVGLSLRH